jgi:hypothetical protein
LPVGVLVLLQGRPVLGQGDLAQLQPSVSALPRLTVAPLPNV